ncbi:MAG TPA: archaeosortase/exosortase family protein, partial [Acidobacteriota bacterium]|nr:archaeosortase/exosortase family protein [Acidobacteriota bacterium]
RTVGVFVGVAGIWFYTLVNALCRHHLWDPFTGFVATATGWVFRLFGAEVYAAGPTLTVNGTTLTIDFGCNGLEAFGIFLAAVVASSSPVRRKLTGLLVGFVGVFILNLIRACGIFIAAATNPDLFQYVHHIVGQTFVIVFTMALYLWWELRGDSGRKAKSQALPA